MDDAKPVKTPVDPSLKFVQATEDERCTDQQVYQSAIRSLLYLSVVPRPDITSAWQDSLQNQPFSTVLV